MEHVDCYSSITEIQDAFLTFVDRIPFYGYAVVCLDDPEIQNILPRIRKRVITYGLSSQANFRAWKPSFEGGVSKFTVYKNDRALGQIRLPMAGLHNVLDSLAAVAVADLFDIPFEETGMALDSFPGVQRRFTQRGKVAGITVIDDYGHHPTEIRAVLQAARQISSGRIAVVFQPHRYTRTKGLFDEFLTCFNDADLLYITAIYPASEQPIEGVTGEALCQGIHSRGHKTVRFLGRRESIAAEVARDLKSGDMVITLGAGDVTNLGPEMLGELRKLEEKEK
jgi:UDP-N-acetylmuramate--alanine ligase